MSYQKPDFCCWCMGTEVSTLLTGKGLSGGLCEEHQSLIPRTKEDKEKLKKVFELLRSRRKSQP